MRYVRWRSVFLAGLAFFAAAWLAVALFPRASSSLAQAPRPAETADRAEADLAAPTLQSLETEIRELRRDVRKLAETIESRWPDRAAPEAATATSSAPVKDPSAAELPVYEAEYPVADLVVPLQPLELPTGSNATANPPIPAYTALKAAPLPKDARPDFRPLIELIVQGVAPDTWSNRGGPGYIREFDVHLSLIVVQTQPVHARIANLLKTLRKLRERQFALTVKVLHYEIDKSGIAGSLLRLFDGETVLAPREAKTLLESPQLDFGKNLVMAPRLTVLSGQAVSISNVEGDPAGLQLKLMAVENSNGRIRLSLAASTNQEAFEPTPFRSVDMQNGATACFDVTDRTNAESNPLLKSLPNRGKLLAITDLPQPAVRTLVFVGVECLDGETGNPMVNPAFTRDDPVKAASSR